MVIRLGLLALILLLCTPARSETGNGLLQACEALLAMGLLRRSSQIGFFIAGIAAIVFVDAAGIVPAPFLHSGTARGPASAATPAPILDASLTVIISGVTCLVSTLGAFSTMFLAWRLDRRQSRETELRIAQLQIEVERSRSQVKVGQS